MSFHVYIEPELESKLEALCKQTGQKRNAIVREALRRYVYSQLETNWPEEVFRFKADAGLPGFEDLRNDLLPERDDVFGEQER